MNETTARTDGRGWNRREVLGAGAGMIAAGVASRAGAAPSTASTKPNFLFIICDQLGLDAISAHGCTDVHTPNIDRLVRRGTTFMESHSTNPVCSPARSSLFTGRMPVETGVITNSRAIHDSVPNMGQWLRPRGYETVYCGKWHVPMGYAAQGQIKGFTVLPVGQGQGDLVDGVVSRTCEAYLKTRDRSKPFVLAASLMNPHDICYWAIAGAELVPQKLPFPRLRDRLPDLPPNNTSRPPAPAKLDRLSYKRFNADQWRYYIWIYYRMVEMVDGEIGRILDALDDTAQTRNTVVLLTSDHGEGRGRHSHVQKWYPYEESVKVPMIVSCPGRVAEGHKDATHLISGLDVMATMCDYAGVDAPPHSLGRSLRPLLERKDTAWREFVVSEHHVVGRMVRTEQFKFVEYADDPVVQLFDMHADPWEKRNLYQEANYASVIRDHRKLLADWTKRLRPVPPSPLPGARRKPGKKT